MFQVNEIKKWAKSNNICVKREKEKYVWFEEGNKENKTEAFSIDDVAKQIFNKITNNNFVEYQNNYKENALQSHNFG